MTPAAAPSTHSAARRNAALGCTALFALVLLLVVVAWSPLRHVDTGLDARLNRYYASRRGAVRFWQDVSTVLAPVTFQVLAVVGGAVLWLARLRRCAVFTLVAVLVGGLLDTVTKVLVGRARPTVRVVLSQAGGKSFPSGHAVGSAVAAGVIIVLASAMLRRSWARVLAAVAVLMAVLVGFSRLALGVHYLSDIVGAWLLSAAWVLLAAEVVRPEQRARQRRPAMSTRVASSGSASR